MKIGTGHEIRYGSRMITDSHLHFDRFAEAGDVELVLARAEATGVSRMVAIGGTVAANQLAADLASRYPGRIRAVVGYDRDEAGREPPSEPLSGLFGRPGVVGVGETGLDYHYSADTAAEQQALFGAMLDTAAHHCLPVVVHSREADEDTLRLLRDHAARWTGDPERIGVLHCFTGSAAFAASLLELGLYIGFSGILTFPNAETIREVAGTVPADRLLIETDAPYLAPPPYRGKRNEPAYVVRVAEVLAEIRGISMKDVAALTSANAARLFGWKETRHGESERGEVCPGH